MRKYIEKELQLKMYKHLASS